MISMPFYKKPLLILVGLFFITLTGCATETHQTVKVTPVETHNTPYHGTKSTLVVGQFENRSSYMHGIFSSGVDELGNQARTILKTDLQQTNHFNVVDRANMKVLEEEANYSGVSQQISGARYVVSGAITEFGRKVTGDKQLFGILGRGKTQTAYAKATLNIVDVKSSEIIYSTQAAGEYELSNREVIGFGGTAGYDSTLNGKVLNLAITEAVNNIVRDIDNGALTLENTTK